MKTQRRDMRTRHAPWLFAVALLILTLTSVQTAACATTASQTPVDLGQHLVSLAEEHEAIAAASLAAYRSGQIDDVQGPRIAKYGVAAGTAIDTAHAVFDAYRLSPNTASAATLDALVKAADVSMIALRALASSAGVTWEVAES